MDDTGNSAVRQLRRARDIAMLMLGRALMAAALVFVGAGDWLAQKAMEVECERGPRC